jgi:hypothetical protein
MQPALSAMLALVAGFSDSGRLSAVDRARLVMPLDPQRIIRIRSTIEAAADKTTATFALIELYTATRNQLLAMLEGDLVTEFEGLFPTWHRRGGMLAGSLGITSSEARTRLRSLVGWLNGLVQGMQYEAQITANAEAYARERVKAERGIGFRAEEGPDGKATA